MRMRRTAQTRSYIHYFLPYKIMYSFVILFILELVDLEFIIKGEKKKESVEELIWSNY